MALHPMIWTQVGKNAVDRRGRDGEHADADEDSDDQQVVGALELHIAHGVDAHGGDGGEHDRAAADHAAGDGRDDLAERVDGRRTGACLWSRYGWLRLAGAGGVGRVGPVQGDERPRAAGVVHAFVSDAVAGGGFRLSGQPVRDGHGEGADVLVDVGEHSVAGAAEADGVGRRVAGHAG
jgi:hypothetical protein